MKKILLLSFVCLSAAFVFADGPLDGKTVKAVEFVNTGNIRIDETFVRSFLSVKEGDELRMRGLTEDVRALLDSGRFTDVSVATEDVADGAKVIFTLGMRARLAAQPVVKGGRYFSRVAIRKAIGLRAGDYVDESMIAAAVSRLQDKYRERRFFDVTVKPSLVRSQDVPSAAYLSFEIEEGPRTRVDFLEFRGAKSIAGDRLARGARQHDWYNPASWVTYPRVSDPDLETVRADALAQYRDAGFLDAVVSAPVKTMNGDRLHVAYDVEEGPQYTIGAFDIEGATLFSKHDLLSLVRLRVGAPASSAAMTAARNALRDYYTSRGYADTSVRLATKPISGHDMAVTFQISEGALVHVNAVRIHGNTITKDKVIRREIGLVPGARYDTVRAELSRRRLMNLGFFQDVRLYDTPAEEDGMVDVHYDLEEQPTGRFSFGAGFSSVDHLVGIFGISQSNFDITNWRTFRGAGQKVRLDATIASESSEVDLSFVDPWFLDRRLSLSTDFFLRNNEYDEYDERRVGGMVGLEEMIPWVGRVGLYFNVSKVTLDDVIADPMHLYPNGAAFSYANEDDDYFLASVRAAWTYDTRDNMIVPTSGTKATVSADFYNKALGSDYDLVQVDAKAYKYFRLPYNLRLALSGRFATIDTYGDEKTVPIGSRFFLGGGRYARGFKQRSIGPKATYDANPSEYGAVGGQSLFWATAELSVPIFDHCRLATFLDVGSVSEDAFDFGLSDAVTSVGVGIRLDFVGFPIRLDYAHPIERGDELTDEHQFVFWVGFDN